MRRTGFLVVAAFIAGCSGTVAKIPIGTPSSSPSSTASPSPTSNPTTPLATPGDPGVATEQHCDAPFGPTSPNVVALGSLMAAPAGNMPPIALLDMTNPFAPRQLCTYQNLPGQVRLTGASS